MGAPFFSVVMPTYQTPPPLMRAAVESVVSQTFADWELIVVDDNPRSSPCKQDVARLVGEHAGDGRVSLLVHDTNLGANVARNDGVRRARGPWLAFLDADDRWDPTYLQQVHELCAGGGCGLVSTRIRVFDGAALVEDGRPAQAGGDIFAQELMGDVLSPSSGVCALRSALIEAGGFDEALPARQDYDMWLRMCRSVDVRFNDAPLVTVVRDGHASISSSYLNHVRGTEAIIAKIERDETIPRELKARAITMQQLYVMKVLCLGGDWERSRAWRARPRRLADRAYFMLVWCWLRLKGALARRGGSAA